MNPDFTATIEQDVACIQCGYNLRGLAGDARCPECNTDVTRSFNGDLLRFADPHWLRRVKLGIDLMFGGLVGTILAAIIVIVMEAVPSVWAASDVSALIDFGFPVVLLIAAFLVTSREARKPLADCDRTWRKLIRSCVTFSVTTRFLLYVPAIWNANFLCALIALAFRFAWIIAVFGVFFYARSFASRIPDRQLERSTRTAQSGLTVLMLLSIVQHFVVVMMEFATTTGGRVMGLAPSGAIQSQTIEGLNEKVVSFIRVFYQLGFLFFGIWAFVLICRYRNAFKAAIKASRTITTPATC